MLNLPLWMLLLLLLLLLLQSAVLLFSAATDSAANVPVNAVDESADEGVDAVTTCVTGTIGNNQQQQLEQDSSKINNLVDYGEDMGVVQDYDVDHEQEIYDRIQQTRKYLQTLQQQQQHVLQNDNNNHNHNHNTQTNNKEDNAQQLLLLRDKCRNRHESCAYWAVMNQCQEHAAYMNETCAPVCFACESLQMEVRCPVDPNAVNRFQPGDLNRMFERIVSHPDFVKYEPRIWSRPTSMLLTEDNNDNNENTTAAPYQIGPWIVTLDKFLSAEEADILIQLGEQEGYERSQRAGTQVQWNGRLQNYVDESRTSSAVFCEKPSCLSHATIRSIMERIEHLTLVPEHHYQHFQFLRYQVGQRFTLHSDYIPLQRYRQEGVRMFTVFFYLNHVEKGGETHFPNLNLTITPQKGRVGVWPVVLDDDPHSVDDRMDHQALPVVQGIKYAANNHVHQRDFKTAHANRCTA